jgi:hypothetical protein
MRAPGKLDHLGGVAGEISDGGVDLAERDLHLFSVKPRSAEAKLSSGLTGVDWPDRDGHAPSDLFAAYS